MNRQTGTDLVARITAHLAVTLLLVSAATTPVRAEERVLREEIPATDVAGIVLTGDIGRVRIVDGSEDTIRIEVAVRPEKMSDTGVLRGIKKWFLSSAYDDLDDLMDALRLDLQTSRSGSVKLGLSPPVRVRDSRVREDWQITVPKRLSVRVAMSRADTEVQGVAGGVEISVGNGSVDVDVPGGDLDIDVTVGRATVRSASESVGKVDLRARVGDTSLWMNGMKVKYTDPPGPGSRVSLSGKGGDSIHISVEVGDASLRVNDR